MVNTSVWRLPAGLTLCERDYILPLMIMKVFKMKMMTFTWNMAICVNHSLGRMPEARQDEVWGLKGR